MRRDDLVHVLRPREVAHLDAAASEPRGAPVRSGRDRAMRRPASAARARHPTAPRGDGVASAAWPCTAGATAQTPQAQPAAQRLRAREIALFGSLRRANGNSCPPIRPGTHARAAPPRNRKARIAVGREHAGSHLRPSVDVVERLVRQHVVEADAPVGCAASAREDPVLVR
jgi:hypothetical protein